MKRLISTLTVLAILFMGVGAYASGGNLIIPDITVIDNHNNGTEFTFAIEWSIAEAKKGDYFFVEFPFPVSINGGDIADVEEVGNKYRLIFKDDYINAWGEIGGRRVTTVESLDPLKINGEAVDVTYDAPESNGGHDVGVAERDRIYKHGTIDGDVINWEVVVNGDEKGVNPNTHVTDEIGVGHEFIKDSLKFFIIESGQYNDRLVDMVVKGVTTSPNEINFIIDQLAPNEVLLFEYQTKITNKDQTKFENMLIVEDERKISESVEIESWGNAGGEKPTTPTEPDEPEPTDPDEPDLPGKLPQVGEKWLKVEHIIGSILLGLGLIIRRKK